MALVYPFRAFRYNPEIAPFDRVLTQPYDKISPAQQEKYYAADPHNLITVEKGRSFPEDTPQNNVYTRAAAALKNWIAGRAVAQDAQPAFYAYSQEFTIPGTSTRSTRRGFIGAGRLEDYANEVVFRHEHTLSGPKADRLELLRHTRTHTGQLFMLYSDPSRKVDAILSEIAAAEKPVTEMLDEYGVVHRLWAVADPIRVAAIQGAMADQKLVIADGHHRYETSLNFRNEMRTRAGKLLPDADYERSMMTFVNTQSEGLIILPTHRVVSNLRDFSWSAVRRYLEPWFATEVFSFTNDAQREEAAEKLRAGLTRCKNAARHRCLSHARRRPQRFLFIDPAPGSRPLTDFAGAFATATQIGCGAAPSRHPGTSAGSNPARRCRRVESHLRTRIPRGAGCCGSWRAGGVSAESRGCGDGDEGGDLRRGDAAEIHGLLSQVDERDHDVSDRGVTRGGEHFRKKSGAG